MVFGRNNRRTVADLRALKGKRQLTMLFVETLDEAAAAAAAGIDLLSIIEPVWSPAMREAAGDCFVQVGLIYGQHCTYEDYLRAAHAGIMTGGDAFYCAGSLDTITKLRVRGHSGRRPCRRSPGAGDLDGRIQAVGKTAKQAMQVYEHVKALEAAGAIGAEIEVVPARVAAEISKRTALILLSTGAGAAPTRNISSPRTCSAIRAATSPAMPKSTATSAPRPPPAARSASPPSRNSAPTWRPAPHRKNTSCRSPTPSSMRS